MKIHQFYKWPSFDEKYFSENLKEHEIVFHKAMLDDFPDLADEEADILSVFVNRSEITPTVLDRFPNLKLVAVQATGYDNIDLVETKKRGIVVSNVPTYGENTVAEHTFALLLTIARHMYQAYKRVEEGGVFAQGELCGFDLKGKTIGVIGTGNIGKCVVRIAHGFGMNILACDPNPNDKLVEEYNVSYCTLEELLSQSDIVTLHVPYNKDTHNLINMDNISMMKHGAYLINTSRGGVIQTAALVGALDSGALAGAGLDVLEEEGIFIGDQEVELLSDENTDIATLKTTLANYYLIDHPRVIVTPHIGYNTEEAIQRIVETTVENIKAFAEGKPQNVVN